MEALVAAEVRKTHQDSQMVALEFRLKAFRAVEVAIGTETPITSTEVAVAVQAELEHLEIMTAWDLVAVD
jgi:hypothetical protein